MGSDNIEVSDKELLAKISELTGRDPTSVQAQLDRFTSSNTHDSPEEVIETVNELGNTGVNQIYQYFTNPLGGGYEWYQNIGGLIESTLIDLIKNTASQDYSFTQPYPRQELAFLWTAYNVLSEILEWLSGKLRGEFSDESQPGLMKPVISFFLNLGSIIVAIKMRELVETDIYGRELEDRNKWGFLLKDMDKQVLSQLMAVLMDTGAIFASVLGDANSPISQALYKGGLTGNSLYNIQFINQAINGLIRYSSTPQAPGWIAWLAQELGFMQGNELTADFLGISLPEPFDLIYDVVTVLIMGNVMFQSAG